jgi:hypothetical protein
MIWLVRIEVESPEDIVHLSREIEQLLDEDDRVLHHTIEVYVKEIPMKVYKDGELDNRSCPKCKRDGLQQTSGFIKAGYSKGTSWECRYCNAHFETAPFARES